jgi:hypothetical protein
MKSINLLLAVVLAFTSISINAQTKAAVKTEKIRVWGNCGMCETRIEKAAKDAGATSAAWDSETNLLAVSYNTAKTSVKNIEQKIASVGHDTKGVRASDASYDKLHGCCKYERVASSETAAASCCKDNAKCTTDGCCKATKEKDCCKPGDAKDACCGAGKSCCAKA